MKKLSCIIIEDEPIAAEILEDYVRQLPQLNHCGTFKDALYALEFLRQESVDLIFLDLHLPRLKGFDFLKTLSRPPQVIVTTAYHQYAVEGFALDVVDYLLKPIEFSRLLQAVNKVRLPLSPLPTKKATSLPQRSFLFFNQNKKRIRVWLDEILYIESVREYIRIHLPDQVIVTKHKIGTLSEQLQELKLLRVHRSFLVVANKIDAYSKTHVEIKGLSIPIGRNYREEVLKKLEG